VTVDPYTLLNLRMGAELRGGWSAYLEGRNLRDSQYISSTVVVEMANAASALFNPGNGRAIHSGLRYSW
jgi:iron complex outermembrane receptor protein